MSIQRRQDWGEETTLDPAAPRANSDADLARLGTDDSTPIWLRAGDLLRTIGGPSALGPEKLWSAPIDLGICTVGSERVPFVAHVLVYMRMKRIPSVAVMNAQYLDDWDLAPRGHPNDGYLEVLELAIPRRQRREFRRRVLSGEHLPHPGIETCRVKQYRCETVGRVVIDGVDYGRHEGFDVSLEPDAVRVAF